MLPVITCQLETGGSSGRQLQKSLFPYREIHSRGLRVQRRAPCLFCIIFHVCADDWNVASTGSLNISDPLALNYSTAVQWTSSLPKSFSAASKNGICQLFSPYNWHCKQTASKNQTSRHHAESPWWFECQCHGGSVGKRLQMRSICTVTESRIKTQKHVVNFYPAGMSRLCILYTKYGSGCCNDTWVDSVERPVTRSLDAGL